MSNHVHLIVIPDDAEGLEIGDSWSDEIRGQEIRGQEIRGQEIRGQTDLVLCGNEKPFLTVLSVLVPSAKPR
jgi:hypothetical protein